MDSASEEEQEPINRSLKYDLAWLDCSSKSDKFAHAILQASSSKFHNRELEQAAIALSEWEFEYQDREEDRCICNQNIKVRFHIRNKITNELAIVGSDCVKKLETLDLNLWTQIKLSIGSEKEHEQGPCAHCCKFMVHDPSKTIEFCKACRDEGIRMPSQNYLAVMGVSCGRCKQVKIVPNLKIPYCSGCVDRCTDCKSEIEAAPGLCSDCEYAKTELPCVKCHLKLRPSYFLPGHKECRSCYEELKLPKPSAKTMKQNQPAPYFYGGKPYVMTKPVDEKLYRFCLRCHQNKRYDSSEPWYDRCMDCY